MKRFMLLHINQTKGLSPDPSTLSYHNRPEVKYGDIVVLKELEPIPEVDPIEKVAKWLKQPFFDFGNFEDIAKKLIAAGLNPEKLGEV